MSFLRMNKKIFPGFTELRSREEAGVTNQNVLSVLIIQQTEELLAMLAFQGTQGGSP